MEIIYDDKKGLSKLPKNIKQIGTESDGRRVYIEDYAYSFIREQIVDEDEDGLIGVLLGEVKVIDDITYIFVKGAAAVTNAAVSTDGIIFTEETWPVVNSTVAGYFDGLSIVGWYLVSNKITSDNIYMINKTDSDNFADDNDIFFMVDPSARDEAFYEKSEKGLTKLPGYVVYYERNEKMQAYMTEHRNETGVSEKSEKEDGRYRELVKERKNPVSRSVKKHLTLVYCLSMLLIIVVLIIGVNSINNYDGNKKNDKDGQQANANVVTTEEETVPVETVPADVTTQEEETKKQEETTKKQEETTKKQEETTKKQEETTKKQEETTKKQEQTKPAQTEAAYQNYTIQQGDTYYKICEKFYGTQSSAGVKKILDFNGLTTSSELLPGSTIKIPN